MGFCQANLTQPIYWKPLNVYGPWILLMCYIDPISKILPGGIKKRLSAVNIEIDAATIKEKPISRSIANL